MIDSTTDVKQCFAQPNTDKSKYPRLICHISSIPVTDRRRVLAGESHNNNGSRDASGQWNMISNDALINDVDSPSLESTASCSCALPVTRI
jgi:hypothetical protein